MATVAMSPAFISVRSKLGNMVFYTRWGNVYARKRVTPRNPDTEPQRRSRGLFRDAMKSWQSLSEEDKQKYRRKAEKLRMAGHNLYISRYIKSHRTEEVQHSEISAPHVQNTTSGLSFIPEHNQNVTAPSVEVCCTIPAEERAPAATG
jgi:hypothetical protein